MLEAKALVYAIVVSLLIAIVSSLLVSLSYMQRLQQTDQFDREQQLRNIHSGVALLSGTPESIIEKKAIDLYGDGKDQVIIGKSDWGLFSVATIQAVSAMSGGMDTLNRALLLGEGEKQILDAALYLADLNKPLGLAGKTQIRGTAYLPKAGVKRASVGGQGYLGTDLIYGRQRNSKSQIPTFQKDKLNRFLKNLYLADNEVDMVGFLKNSFQEETKLVKGKNFYLYDQKLKGKVLLYASDSIYLDASNEIEDIVVCANHIVIGKGFKGSLQAFAFQSLVVEEESELLYPSVLGTIRQENMEEVTSLKISESTRVDGLVFAYESKFFRKSAKMAIGENSVVTGQVYASGTLELAGTVNGNVTCKQFFLRTSSSTYDNHLLGATINREKLPADFVGGTCMKEGAYQQIAKWLE